VKDCGWALKAKNFREIKGMSYSRRKYMRGVPGSKIVKFTMGNPTGEFDYTVELTNLKDGQIRHNALEAARIAGTAARVRRGSPILIAEVDERGLEVAREALKRASDKFPVTSRIIIKHN